MSHEERQWTLRTSQLYQDQLDDRRYRARRREIERRIDLLRQDPYRAAHAERLKHDFAGLRSARLFGGVRVIYRICEECRRLGEQRRSPLDCCFSGATPDRTINLLCLSEHYRDVPGGFDFDD